MFNPHSAEHLIRFISMLNHCCWHCNESLNIKICEVWCQIKQILVIFNHLKLRVHNFNWVKMYINPFKPLFTIVIFIHYKPRIAVTILDL